MVSNIDTLLMSFDFYDYTTLMAKEFEYFEKMKKKASEKSVDVDGEKIYVMFLGMRFEILGNGKKGYSFILHSELFEIDIARYRSRNEDMYPVMVRFKAELLWMQGLNAYHYLMDKFVKYMTEPVAEKVSRVDMACHIEGLDLQIDDIDKFIGRHRKDSVHRKDRRVQTIYIGSRKTQTIMLRVYNKSSMIIEERKGLWFVDVWNDNEMNPTDVWNVEFELHRKALKELGIETYRNLSDNLRQLWEYLTKKWVRHVDLESASRRENCTTTSMWLRIQEGFKDLDLNGYVERDVIQLRKMDGYIPAIAGYLSSYASMMNFKDIDAVLEHLSYHVPHYLEKTKNKTFEDVVKDKYGQQVLAMLIEYELRKGYEDENDVCNARHEI